MRKKAGVFARFFLSFTLFLFVAATVTVAVCGIAAARLDTEVPAELLTSGGKDRTTRLFFFDANGERLELAEDRVSGAENALFCPISEIPENLKNAFIAIEDKRFYRHSGVDWRRTAAAALGYLKGEGNFGGSTLTQQLVKNLTGETERSVGRKAAEIIRAAKAERILPKERILEEYLNVVNLAENCYGVRTAANTYFSKEPAALTLRECAAIAAITNNPTRYDPIRHPAENRARRDLILSEMRAQGMITEEAYREAVDGETELHVNRAATPKRVNSWFADLVIADVIRALTEEKGMSEGEAARLVYCGGLQIETTVNPAMEEVLTAYYLDPAHFPAAEGKQAQSAMMIVDPASGAILAVAGAVGEKTGNRVANFATDAHRPSGSVLKPLAVYAPAVEKDLVTWATVFDDVPLRYRDNGAPWPRNSPNFYRGLTNLNAAITHSVNTVSVETFGLVGADASFDFLTSALGFTSLDAEKDKNAIALALGQQTAGVTLREVVGGYTALAGGGVYRGTHSFIRVTDAAGNVLLTRKSAEKRVLSNESAALMTLLLRGVTQHGTGSALTLKKHVETAGKTGTSSRNCDKWFVGYTPELLAGVWYGYEYPEPLTGLGGNPALAVFDGVMNGLLPLTSGKTHFDTPETLIAVRYCRDSGKLPSPACALDPRGDRSEVGYFKKGTEPTESCTCHVAVDYCECGGVATPDCPPECRRQTALLRVVREFPRQIAVADAPYTYGGEPTKSERILSSNEPYYAIYYDLGTHFGIPFETSPYNRACPVHSGDDFWRRRAAGN